MNHHSELASFLRRHREAILADWMACDLERVPATRRLTETDLRDHMPHLLDAVADAIEGGARIAGRASEPRLLSTVHALHRIESGLSLEEVTGEYGLLRQAILSLPDIERMPLDQRRILHRFIDRAIVEAVVAYTEAANQRLEEEREKRTEFERHLMGIVGHDLRSPCTAILIAAGVLLRNPGLDDQQTRIVSSIVSAANRANRLIHDLIDFTTMRQGNALSLEPADADLHELVQEAAAEIRLTHPQRDIELRLEGPAHGRWDRGRLIQVLTNLLSNAVRYSPANSAVAVRVYDDAGDAMIRVHNDGPPIPEELKTRLFQPLERGGERRASGGRSVGLGLYIVRHIVAAHGGTIDLRSAPGCGTTFTIRLPRWRS